MNDLQMSFILNKETDYKKQLCVPKNETSTPSKNAWKMTMAKTLPKLGRGRPT